MDNIYIETCEDYTPGPSKRLPPSIPYTNRRRRRTDLKDGFGIFRVSVKSDKPLVLASTECIGCGELFSTSAIRQHLKDFHRFTVEKIDTLFQKKKISVLAKSKTANNLINSFMSTLCHTNSLNTPAGTARKMLCKASQTVKNQLLLVAVIDVSTYKLRLLLLHLLKN